VLGGAIADALDAVRQQVAAAKAFVHINNEEDEEGAAGEPAKDDSAPNVCHSSHLHMELGDSAAAGSSRGVAVGSGGGDDEEAGDNDGEQVWSDAGSDAEEQAVVCWMPLGLALSSQQLWQLLRQGSCCQQQE